MDRKDELYKKVIAGLIAGTDEDGNVIITDEDWKMLTVLEKKLMLKSKKRIEKRN